MLILDTNHYSEIERGSHIGQILSQRLRTTGDEGFLTIITPEEVMKGWIAAIQPHRQPDGGVSAYRDFHRSLQGFHDWFILPWSADAVEIFRGLRKQKLLIGTKDLCIAAVALEYGAMVLTRNLRDFSRVPGLRVENWLD